MVDDPSSVDVDATTSASVLAPGHVSQMAGWIQEETGGDLFSIKVADPYSSDYDECLDRAADEKADNARPALSGSVSNMEDHDVVFLGYPDWWSTCPMAIFSFLDSYDFSGKTIIPFCAHGTSGLGSSVRDIKAALPGVTVLDAVGVQRPGMDTPLNSAESTVKNWLARLDY
nr:flavodoxin [uncultured Oscillibacter sp.]